MPAAVTGLAYYANAVAMIDHVVFVFFCMHKTMLDIVRYKYIFL